MAGVIDSALFERASGTQRVLVQFNKVNGTIITHMGWIDPETLNNDYYLYEEVELDPSTETVVGSYGNLQVVKIAEQPLTITEVGLNALAAAKITKEYTVEDQLNIMARLLQKLAETNGVEHEELAEMIDYIDEVRQANALRKESYAASADYNYISDEQAQATVEQQLEGGLHEAYGPRSVTATNSNISI